jgi:DNA-binding response OmpR family regulator
MSEATGISNTLKPRVVILEDERQLVDLFELCIRDWFRNAEIISFQNGNAAWQEVEAREPALLIMDCSHPGLNGVEIMERLAGRQTKCTILLTSELFAENLKKLTNRGLKVAYLPKPFGIVQFWKMLNEHIGPSDFPERQALIGS